MSPDQHRRAIAAITACCGFANANYLKRIFLAETGMTLSDWRTRKQKG